MQPAVTINPATPVALLQDIIRDVYMVLIMSVNPGFGGQKFIVESLEKIRKVRGMIEKSGQAIDLEVDGGIYQENVEEVLKAGANVIVAGSAVFGGNPGENTRVMMERLKQYE